MIAWLFGEVISHSHQFIILKSGNIGYKIVLPESVVLSFNGEREIYVHELIRDQEHELFGMPSKEGLEFFLQLLSVSGVGPKSAQKIVFADELASVKKRIFEGDLSFFSGISGIGKKTAQKIILDLKGVIVEDEISMIDQEAFEALISLGYTKRQVEDGLKKTKGSTTEERIREFLQQMK